MIVVAPSPSLLSLASGYRTAAELCSVAHFGCGPDRQGSLHTRRTSTLGFGPSSGPKQHQRNLPATKACLHFEATTTRRRARRRRYGGGSSDDDDGGNNDGGSGGNYGWNNGGSGGGGNGWSSGWSSGGWSGGWQWWFFSNLMYEGLWVWQLICACSLLQALHFAVLGDRKHQQGHGNTVS